MVRTILAVAAACLPLAAQVTIDAKVTLVISPREPAPLRKAAGDLASDLEKVFGAAPRRADTVPASGTAIVVALAENLPAPVTRPHEAEASLAQTVGRSLILTGGDMRGAMYAVYEFSRQQLQVDPLYYWTDHVPQRRARVNLPAGFRHAVAPPAFRYRGWFINDEDLLTGWKPATPGGTGISLEVWDRIFEALLRLKGNMIVPGTFIFPDEPQVKAAGERGLIVNQHHIEVLGTNTWKWPADQPYSFAQHPQLLVNAWRNSMRGYAKDQEVLWTVGYRGRHDRAFWLDDTSIAPTCEARGQAIRQAIDKQVELVRAEHTAPHFIMNAWDEAVPLIRQGCLKLPEGVTLVWPDNGHGLIKDGGGIVHGQGVYYHTAMHDFVANQLTEMVPLERIGRELGRAVRARATEYLLVNVSDVRPYPLTTQAVMELGAAPAKWTPDEYLGRWCRDQFGERAAPAVAAYYRAFFAAPGHMGPAEDEVLADTGYHNYLRYFLVTLIKGRPELSKRFIRISDWDKFTQQVLRATREAEPRWAAARLLAQRAELLIPADRRQFFQAHVMTQLAIHEHANRALRFAAESKIAETVAELKLEVAAMQAAEYGKWKGFYAQDRFDDVRGALTLAEACAGKLAGKPLPAGLDVRAIPMDPYFWLKSYQDGRSVDVR